MLGMFLSACNDNGGGGVSGDGSVYGPIDTAIPFASDTMPLPGAGSPAGQGHLVTGVTATVSDATISVVDGDGTQLFYDYGDGRAGHSFILPPGTVYPVLVTASNGLDLVTGLPPVITMVSVVEKPTDTTANLTPLTTLIVKTAQAMPGGVNPSNLALANQYIVTALNFGMDSIRIPNPITTAIDAQNIVSMVKAGRVLTETLTRSVLRLSLSGTVLTEDELLDALAADMVDGRPDGVGAAGADPFLSALTNVVLAQVMLESIGNTLQSEGLPLAAGMDSAIKTMLPGIQASIAEAVVSRETLTHLKLLIHAAQPVTTSDDSDLAAVLAAIGGLGANMLPADIAPLLPVVGSAAFDAAISGLVSTEDNMVYQSVLSAFTKTHQHRLLALAWYPSDDVDGYIVHAGPTPSTATVKVSVVPTASVELDVQTDLGLSPGDNVCFRIKAFNASGVSAFSGAVCAVI